MTVDRKIRMPTHGLATGLLLIIFGVLAITLTAESLWEDEVWSLWAVSGSLAETLAKVAGDYHPPLYFLLLKGWIALVGDAPIMVRLPSLYAVLLALAPPSSPQHVGGASVPG